MRRKYSAESSRKNRWQAMYIDSRPVAVDRGTSSAAVVRTSRGNEIRHRRSSMRSRIRVSTSGPAASGTAYSISVNRTRRGDTKASCAGAR